MGRTPCCDKNGLKKGPWTHEEDLKLTRHIQLHGACNWRTLPKNAGLQRCGKSCRLRWTNYLRPDIKRGRFSFEEEETIIQLHRVLGNKWSAIAARLSGRTDNEIKNYWNTSIRKRLLRMGIDPVTHTARIDRLDLPFLLNSAQFNLSNLLGLQTLVNPGTLKLLSALLASNTQNPEVLSQKFQENQFFNPQIQNQTIPLVQDYPFQDIPISTPPGPSCSSYPNQNPDMYRIVEQFLMNTGDSGEQKLQENMMPSDASFLCEQNNGYPILDQTSTDLSENSSALHLNDYSNPSSQKFGIDSCFSTPLSGSPLTSSSAFINSITEDEKESCCSDFLKFEIPESLDFDDFM